MQTLLQIQIHIENITIASFGDTLTDVIKDVLLMIPQFVLAIFSGQKNEYIMPIDPPSLLMSIMLMPFRC